jgi:hypothetical protein
MIKRAFTAIHEFLLAWGEHRYQQTRNRTHGWY